MYDRSAAIIRNVVDGVLFGRAAEATDYIADKLFDPRLVPMTNVKVPQVDASMLRQYDTRKGTDADPNLVDRQVFLRDVTLEHHKLAARTDPSDEADTTEALRWIYSDSEKAQLVLDGLLVDREGIAAQMATDATRYPSSLQYTLAAGDRWDDNGDPQYHMRIANSALRATCGRSANAIAMDVDTYEKLQFGTFIRSRTQYTNGGTIPDSIFKAFFGVEHIFVGRAQRNSAVEGATDSIAGFWGRYAIAFVYQPSTSRRAQCNYGHMWQINSAWNTTILPQHEHTSVDGPMRRVQVATKYLLDPGFVESKTSSKFAAGVLFTTCVGA